MSLLFIIICITFIGLGLPDSLLGAIWPTARIELSAPLSFAGIVAFVVSFGTIVSSLMCTRLVARFKTHVVTTVSVLLTAIGVLGYSFSPSVAWLLVFAVPLGLGAGSVDASLNNFVALYYKAKHMSWLHCFWGVGATLGPVIVSLFIAKQYGWRLGVRTVSFALFAITLALIISKNLWKKADKSQSSSDTSEAEPSSIISNKEAVRLPGMKFALISFFCYCSAELTTGLWSASYLVETKGLDAATAASWVSLYYVGITVGRLLLGFVMDKVSSKNMIRFGLITSFAGVILYLLPLPSIFSLVALLLIGFGFAPIYPCTIHETPHRFGEKSSQAAIGLQMATAYLGNTLMPLALGFVAQWLSISVLPLFLLVFIAIMGISTERINSFLSSNV